MRIRFATAAVMAFGLLVPAPVTAAETAESTAVTLITGDRVIVGHRPGGGVSITVDPATTRPGVAYSATTTKQGHTKVVPSDALPLLAAGTLDARLFDITELIADGYDDARARAVPVIAQRAKSTTRTSLTGGTIHGELRRSGFDAVKVDKRRAPSAWRDLKKAGAGVQRLWLDGRRQVLDDLSNAQIGAPTAWSAGYTGTGVTVAVLDTGYDQNHADLAGVVTQSKNFTTTASVQDGHGHGTHVASTIAGNGAGSAGKYRGVAPGAKLAIGKVLNDQGFGTDSSILAGMEWAATEVKAKIVSMSLGGPDFEGVDPLEAAVNRLSGSLFVIAAGNSGPDAQTVSSPGSADAALTVGAVDRSDQLASFSGRGPRLADMALKPDITAPGVGIIGARASGTGIGTPVDARYTAASGTSMATPHVSGAAAVLAQEHPGWSPFALKGALMSTAHPVAGQTADQEGAGRLDLAAAVAAPIAPTVAGTGYLPWPHSTGQVAARLMAYSNGGAQTVALTLSVTATDASGSAAPAGLFTLSRTQFGLAAGATDGATLYEHGDVAAPGRYFATVTARTATGAVAATSVVDAYVEPRTHIANLSVTGADGNPGVMYFSLYNATTGQRLFNDGLINGSRSLRLQPGEYTLTTYEFGDRFYVGVLPLTITSADVALNLDLRQAKPLSATVDQPDAAMSRSDIVVEAPGILQDFFTLNPARQIAALPSAYPGATYLGHLCLTRAGSRDSPYQISLSDYRADGGIPANPAISTTLQSLTHISHAFWQQGGTAEIDYVRTTWMPNPNFGPLCDTNRTQAGLEEYLTPSSDLTRDQQVFLGRTSNDYFAGSLVELGLRYPTAGDNGTKTWFHGVIGPRHHTNTNDGNSQGASRRLNTLFYTADGLYSDLANPLAFGWDTHATGTVTLSRDGLQIASVPLTQRDTLTATDLPSGSATYTLAVSATRDVSYATLSTKIDTVWTFPSASTTVNTAVPLLTPTIFPWGVNSSNKAAPGSSFTVSIIPTVSSGSIPALATTTVDVSFDDGVTWTSLPVSAGPYVTVQNPNTAGFASFRVGISDANGRKNTTTIIRAYQIA